MPRVQAGPESLDHVRVEVSACVALYLGKRSLSGPRLPVGPVVSQGIEHVGNRNDAGGEWNLPRPESLWIARPIPALMVRKRHLLRRPDGSGPPSGQNPGPCESMLLHDRSLQRAEWSRFAQNGVRHGNLAHVMQWSRSADQVDRDGTELQGTSESRGRFSDSPCVEPGVIVVQFCRLREPFQNLTLGLFQLMGSFPNLLLQGGFFLSKSDVQCPRFQQNPDPKQHLDRVEWLGEKVLRARGECTLPNLAGDIRRQHEHRKILTGRQTATQRPQNLEPVHTWHVQIQKHDVRLIRRSQTQGPGRIGAPEQMAESGRAEDFRQQLHAGDLVVNDQYPGCGGVHGCVGRESETWRALTMLPLASYGNRGRSP